MQDVISSIIVLAGIIFVLVNEFYQRKVKVPPMPSCRAVRNKMIELIPDNVEGNIIELGSGWGGLARKTSKKYPNNKVIGYELSVFPFIFSKIRQFFSGSNIEFVRENFFKSDLSNASVILCYLSNPVMAKLKEKFLEELPQDALIISSIFYIPDWSLEEKIVVKGVWDTEIFVYRRVANV